MCVWMQQLFCNVNVKFPRNKCGFFCSPSLGLSFRAVSTFYWSFFSTLHQIFCSLLQLRKEWPHLQGLQGAQEGEGAGLLQLWQSRPCGPRLRPRQRAEVLLLRRIRAHTERMWEGQMLQVDNTVICSVSVVLFKKYFTLPVFVVPMLMLSLDFPSLLASFHAFTLCVCVCRCGEIGHVAVQCSKASEVNCYNCGKSGHLAKECTIEATA